MLSLYSFYDSLPEVGGVSYIMKAAKPWDKNTVTWFQASTGIKWDQVGGDYVGSPVSSIVCKPDATSSWVEYTVATAIDEFLKSPQSNNGFIILFNSTDRLDCYSSDYIPDTALRPKLVVTYTTDSPIKTLFKKDTGGLLVITVVHQGRMLKISAHSRAMYTTTIHSVTGALIARHRWYGTQHLMRLPASLADGVIIVSVTGTPGASDCREVMKIVAR